MDTYRLPDRVTVVGRPALDATREPFEAVGRYAEIFWLPVLGPTAMWFLRAAHRRTHGGASAWDVEADELAGMLGVDRGQANRTVNRLAAFQLAAHAEGDVSWLVVATRLPWLQPGRVRRLPDGLRNLHDAYQHAHLQVAGHEPPARDMDDVDLAVAQGHYAACFDGADPVPAGWGDRLTPKENA